MVSVESLAKSLFREGGAGSGRHSVDDAIDAYNAKVRAKMHPPKKEAKKVPFKFAFTEAFMPKTKEAATSSGVAGGALTRAGAKPWPLN